MQVSHHEPMDQARRANRPSRGAKPSERTLVLPTDRPLRLKELDVAPGQTVMGEAGGRATVRVLRAGLVVSSEGARFENIDFVWDHLLEARPMDSSDATAGAMLIMQASRAEFHGCSFTSSSGRSLPVAIQCADGGPAAGAKELLLSDCLFGQLSAVAQCRDARGVSVEVTNTLLVDAGALLQLARPPAPDAVVSLTLDRVTLLGKTAVFGCRQDRPQTRLGSVTIIANDSALAPEPPLALLMFAGRESPDALLKSIDWNGQGTLISPAAEIAARDRGAELPQSIASDELSMAGLVRSVIEFVAPASHDPSASRVVRWQAPLRSAEPPGIAALPKFQAVRRQ
jgi:hypothetical protein